ncbi:hypothetical protein FRC12_025148 [Ceratobasidium sp. 428]|nr:hypothetical protein FRC12_025148 [Ceratobasidium sp. 428]
MDYATFKWQPEGHYVEVLVREPPKPGVSTHWGKPVGVSIPYITRGNDTSVHYLLLPGLGAYTVILLKDITERASGNQEVLQKDFSTKRIACDLWNMQGGKIEPTATKNLDGARKWYKYLDSSSPSTVTYANYKNLWARCYWNAVNIALAEQHTYVRNKSYNPIDRFFVSKIKAYTLYIEYLEQGVAIDKTVLKQLGEKYKVDALPYDDYKGKEELRVLHVDPMGFYQTRVTAAIYKEIRKEQTDKRAVECDDWNYPTPGKTEVQKFNRMLLNRTTRRKKTIKKKKKKVPHHPFRTNSPTSKITTTVPKWQGERMIRYDRNATQSYMGRSANKWAHSKLGWAPKKKGTVYAEWLHRAAHRFENATADRFSNMIFGTRECNTDMMRTEETITRLLDSPKIYQVLIQVTSECLYEDDDDEYLIMPHIRWCTEKLNYDFTVQDFTAARSTTDHNVVFSPFSLQHPFRFEFELDKLVLDRFLGNLPGPAVAANDGLLAEDILAGWKLPELTLEEKRLLAEWRNTEPNGEEIEDIEPDTESEDSDEPYSEYSDDEND